MIVLPKSFYDVILDTAKKGRPEEICGLIGGIKNSDEREVKEIYVLENIDHSNDQLNAVKDMRAKGYVPLGNFHSHPESPSRPSEEDKRLAYDKDASYMIISLMDIENPVLKSFRIVDNVSTEEEIKYI